MKKILKNTELKNYLEKNLSSEYENFLNTPAEPTAIRINNLKTSDEQFKEFLDTHQVNYQEINFNPHGLILYNDEMPLSHSLAFFTGKFQYQGVSSQLPAILLDPQPGEKILDILRDPVFNRDALDKAMQPAELPSDIAPDEEDDRTLALPFKDVQLASAANFFSLPADELKAALDPDGGATFAEINKRIGDAMRVAWRNMTDKEKDADRGSDKMANTGQRLIKILQQG